MQNYIIGIDGGGSKTHAVILDSRYTFIDEIVGGPANINSDLTLAYTSIHTTITTLLTKHNLQGNNVAIGIGVAGYSNIKARIELLNLLTNDYRNINLNSDCHIACLAAHSGHNGSIVICGTGIAGYSIQNNIGNQIGGWGFPQGDLGGAAWLGLEICRYTGKAIDGSIDWSNLLKAIFSKFSNDTQVFKQWLLKATASDFASIARLLIDSPSTDAHAQNIFNNAIMEVTSFIQAVKKHNPDLAIKIVGGLATTYLPSLKQTFPDLELSTHPPAYGACLLSM